MTPGRGEPRCSRAAAATRHRQLLRAHLGFVEPLSEPVHHPRGRCLPAAAAAACRCHRGCRLPARAARGTGASPAPRREARLGRRVLVLVRRCSCSSSSPGQRPRTAAERGLGALPQRERRCAPKAPRAAVSPQNIARPAAAPPRRMRRGGPTRPLPTGARARDQSDGGRGRPLSGLAPPTRLLICVTRAGGGETTRPSMPRSQPEARCKAPWRVGCRDL